MTQAEREALHDFIIAAIEAHVATVRRELEEVRTTSMRYRGVWQAAQEYQRGDAVTQGGGLWHCNSAAATTEKPGTSPAWTLAVKHG